MDEIKEIEDIRIRHPATISLCGSSFSGKTTLIFRILDDIEYVMNFKPTQIYYVYGIWQDRFQHYKDNGSVRFFHGWNHDELEKSALPRDSLLIIDDSAEMLDDKDWLRSFYTKDSHHLSISIITVFHNVFCRLIPNMRELSQNCMYTFLTSSKRCYDQIEHFGRQVFKGGAAKSFLEIYKKICEDQPFRYLLINLHPLTNSVASLRTNIFRDEQPTVAYVPKLARGKK